MRKLVWPIIILSLLGVFILMVYPSIIWTYPSGAPSGFTGSPVDGRTCATPSCHSGPPNLVSGWVNTDIPVEGYLPGQTYLLTFTASRPSVGRYGFQASILDTTESHSGFFSPHDPTQTQLGTGAHYITHTTNGSFGTSGQKSWEVEWTAPNNYPLWPVTVYAAFVAGDSLGNDSVYLTHMRLNPKGMGIADLSYGNFSGVYVSDQTLHVIFDSGFTPEWLFIYNLQGQKVYNRRIQQWEMEINIHLDTWKGIHLLSFGNQSKVNSLKVIF